MKDNDSYGFTCSKCSGHELVFQHHYTIRQNVEETIYCTCKEYEGMVAAVRKSFDRIYIIEDGYINEDMHPVLEGKDEWGRDGITIDDECIDCRNCYANEDTEWEVTKDSQEVEEDSHRWDVHCKSCGHKIECEWAEGDDPCICLVENNEQERGK